MEALADHAQLPQRLRLTGDKGETGGKLWSLGSGFASFLLGELWKHIYFGTASKLKTRKS